MAIDEKLIEVDRSGRKMPVYIASPEGAGQHPAVIVVHEIFGLNDHIKDIARRFAAASFIAFAPDLFEGHAGLPEDRNDLNGMRAVWSNIPDAQLIEDLQGVFELAKKDARVDAAKIGTIGYCMGGAIAFMFGCSTPGVAWIGDYYGRIRYLQLTETKSKHPIDYVETLGCPVIGLFAGHDELITADHIAELKARVEATGQRCEFKTYENAKHAFFNDVREFYNEDAAKDAWQRTLAFVSKV